MAASLEAAQALLLDAKGCDLLVLNPGSVNLRVGLANCEPLELRHCVAYARRAASAPQPQPLVGDGGHEIACRQLEASLGLPFGLPAEVCVDEPAAESDWEQPPPRAADGSPAPALFGEAALRLTPEEDALRLRVWPMRGGRLDVRPDQPLHRVLDAVEDVWRWALEEELGLSRARLSELAAVLVVPCTLPTREVWELAGVLLRRLGLRACVVHTEGSACAAAAVAGTACIVTLGAQSSSVVCVEEGAEVAASRIILPLGSEDVQAALPWLARRGGGAWPAQAAETAPWWGLQAEGLLARLTYAPSRAALPPQGLCQAAERLSLPGGRSALVRLGSAALLAPSALFSPALLPRARGQESAEAATPLDEAVMRSILALAQGRPDARLRLLASILLVGGGAQLPGVAEALTERLGVQAQGEQVYAVVARPDPRFAAWRGGGLLACLDTQRDGWIGRDQLVEGVCVGAPGRYDASWSAPARVSTFLT